MSRAAPQHQTIGKELPHDSADAHVRGSAVYIDDMVPPQGTLYVAFALAKVAHGKILSIDSSQALSADGVHHVLLAEDIQHLYIGAIKHDEPLLAKDEVLFYGQALCAVVADSHQQAWRAAALVHADIEEMEAITTIEQAIEQESYLCEHLQVTNGDASAAISNAPHQLAGRFRIGGQEHFYLEPQIALAIPQEQTEMLVYSSTQNPTEVQHLIAHVLGVPQHSVEVMTRRMGGGFGGKETDANQVSCIAALLARKLNRAVKIRLPRYEDFLLTGKRHDFLVNYRVGFDDVGMLRGLKIDFAANCGYSMDLSHAIVCRTLFHADNAYYVEHADFTGRLCKTHKVSNTAFRGFGGPQGMLAIESIMEDIAVYLQQDALKIRTLNLYQTDTRNTTPYGQYVENNVLPHLMVELAESADYQQRRAQVEQFNATHKTLKKGLAMSPVKFGISFTSTFLNQAGALVHIYKDGSIYLNHGGTEMGQGLFIKVAQVVAEQFGVDVSKVKVSATSTAKVPNTSPTAASSGSDMNGMAALVACQRIKAKLQIFAEEYFVEQLAEQGLSSDDVDLRFERGKVCIDSSDKLIVDFDAFVQLAFFNRVELFSNGFYKTPKIHYDPTTMTGRPFYYYANGVSISEVIVDCLTGEYKLLAVDICHDVGDSLNPAIDRGQIVGGFIQGMGWLTSEQLSWSDRGVLQTTGAASYKIPSIGDTPKRFNVTIKRHIPNPESTIYRSKAVGEPPLMLANSVWLAIKNAISSVGKKDMGKAPCLLNAPASFEEVFFKLKDAMKA